MIVARPRSSSFSGIVAWSVAAAKCGSGVRVHGGKGKLDQLGWSAKRLKSLGRNSLFSRLPSRHIRCPSLSILCLMMEERDGPGRRGWFPLSMHVHIFRTKMPSPDREGPFSGSNIKVVIDDERTPA